MPGPVRLAYDGRDGHPRVIPVGFMWTGTAVVVCTATTAPKVGALTERPHVALTFDEFGALTRALLVRGTASIEIVDGVPQEYLDAAAKSSHGDDLARFTEQVRGIYPQMARISITPTWARYFDFGGGPIPGFLSRLVAGSGSG